MKTIVLIPTIEEGMPFILGKPPVPVFISGVGAAETAAAVVRAVKAKKPDLIVLAGIAGSYDPALPIGTVVEVTQEHTASLPQRYAKTYAVDPVTDLPEAVSNTVESAGGAPQSPKEGPCPTTQEQGAIDTLTNPEVQIENMEGAALFAVCEALGVRCCEIRAISNLVGEPFEAWDIPLAVENLTQTLNQLLIPNE